MKFNLDIFPRVPFHSILYTCYTVKINLDTVVSFFPMKLPVYLQFSSSWLIFLRFSRFQNYAWSIDLIQLSMFIILMIIVLYHTCRINTRGIYCHLDRWGSKTDNDESFFDCLKVQVLFQKKNSYVCFLFKSK